MMKELRVEDALLYLDQVKMEFGDRPHIYNEFLDIMKTFKTQQIDTPGVIRRVSNLFQGNRRLVLGFNTFLPEGYKIEIPADGEGPPVAVFRAPGSTVTHVLNPGGTTTTTTTTTTTPGTAGVGASQSQPGSPSLAAQANSAAARALAGLPPGAPPSLQIPGVSLNRGPPPQGARPAGVRGPHSPLGGGVQPPSLGGAPGMPPAAPGTMQAAQLSAVPGAGGGQPQKASPRQPMPPQQQQAPLEFDHAINYVTTIKKRFANEPETYKKFLEILHTYQKEQRGINEVLDEVQVLFSEHPDLLKQFTYFLPDAVQAQAKARLDVAAREAEEKLKRIKMAKMAASQQQQSAQDMSRVGRPPAMEFDQRVHVPFGATQGRSPEEEKEIIQSAKYGNVSFAPVRPPRHPIAKMGQGGIKPPRPRSIPESPVAANAAETAFFNRVKQHLSRKELTPEKSQGLKKNTPYTEFLKCLHLFGAGVLNKEEVILLLRGLFTQGHAPRSTSNNPQVAADANELLKGFEQMMVGRGPFAQQEEAKKNKSKYGSLRCRDMNFSKSTHPTPSYYAYPDDFPSDSFLVHPSQQASDAEFINSKYVSIPGKRSRNTESLEVYDGIKKRHNAYEDAMARVEDERYEIDMAIARNAQALVQIEPLAQEALALRQGEEKDGQPIGRLQYSLKKAHGISSVVINAIARVYGDRGDEVLLHLAKNPLVVLPIVYQRLKQKHDEWRKIRDSLKDQWSAVTEANYEGCMDVQCYYRRREVERKFAADYLVEQCKSEQPSSIDPETDKSVSFSNSGLPDERALLFEPCLILSSEVGPSHHDAFQLISIMVNRLPGSAAVDLERIGRIWAEFMMPWYGYPGHWICDEVRKSYAGRLSHSVVKFAVGQKVRTIFGDGTVTNTDAKGGYRVKLPFGTSFLEPTAILHGIPSKDTPFIRRDGVMVRDTDTATKTEGPYLIESSQVLFATRRIYLFLRLHLQLCNMLSELRDFCDGSTSLDPATLYTVPPREDPKPESTEPLDYTGMLSSLKEVVAKKCNLKTFETLGRKISKDNVHVISALPKLVEKCAEALFSLAKEDALFHLYDYCQYRELNPAIVREHCFSMAPDADFRVQFDGKTTAFSYMPKGAPLPSGPRQGELMAQTTSGKQDDAMDIDENGSGEPLSKRIKTN